MAPNVATSPTGAASNPDARKRIATTTHRDFPSATRFFFALETDVGCQINLERFIIAVLSIAE
jgi:hypothetical protein